MTARLLTGLSRCRCRPRWMHQAVVTRPSPYVSGFSNEHLHAVYEDLMTLDHPATPTPQSRANLQPLVQLKDLVLDKTPSLLKDPSKTVDGLLAEYAEQGNTRDLESFISRLSVPPTEHQRDLHVKAHIINARISSQSSSFPIIQQFPTGALTVLHQYETNGCFASIKSYTRVISALFNVQTYPSSDPRLGRTAARAQAWDLFAHMRYVAHPVPDAHLYALMIRACGSFSQPEPERALDLWAEMQEHGIEPTKGAYEAIIRVCGRAGQEWLGEGLRLAREMSDRYSMAGVSGKGLWCALLEGCKRVGDLKKARWILAEAVRGSEDGANAGDPILDAELMTHIFHTYVSYKPPFRRETTRLIDRGVPSTGEQEIEAEEISNHSNPSANVSTEQSRDDVLANVEVESVPSFSRLPPQTPSDVIAEARALFDRIIQDRQLSMVGKDTSSQGGLLMGKFAHVELTPMLLNAYLSVFYKHASIETSQEAFGSLFHKSGIHPDEHSCINALERCAMARVEDRPIATRWAENIWQRWQVIEAQGLKEGKINVGSFARLIEKAHSVMRRVLIQSGDIDGALTLLRSFVAQYPPNSVFQQGDASPITLPMKPTLPMQLFAKPPILSTRTVLNNPPSSTARPLVRLTSAVSPKDDRVPPIVAFGDVDLLHARLVEHGRIKDLGYIKWVCMAYANVLKKRRRHMTERELLLS